MMLPQDVSHGNFGAGQKYLISMMQSLKEQMKRLEQRQAGMRPSKRSPHRCTASVARDAHA